MNNIVVMLSRLFQQFVIYKFHNNHNYENSKHLKYKEIRIKYARKSNSIARSNEGYISNNNQYAIIQKRTYIPMLVNSDAVTVSKSR